MRAKDVMTTGVVSIGETASLQDAARAMLTHRISGMPVTDPHGRLVGMISEGDLLRRTELGTERQRPKWLAFILGPGRMAAEYAHAHGRFVGEVMTREAVSVAEDAELADIVQLMQKHRIKRVPVVREERVVGVVSRADLLRALQDILGRGVIAPAASDLAIRSALLAALEEEKWAPKATIHVSVADGAVTLSGCIFDDRERDGLRVLAENIPGVKSVKDEMVTVEPYADAFLPPIA